jgi:beta-glucosidase
MTKLLAGSTPIAAGIPGNVSVPIYLNPAYSPQERAADLVSRLTLPDKAAEMKHRGPQLLLPHGQPRP